MNVLIVDDEALARVRLRTLLGDCAGIGAVTEAASAAQALALLRQQPCDLLLLDIHMPGSDGLALAQDLRALPRPPAIVFVTAHAEHAVQAFELEAADYLTKPVRLQRLQQALDKARRHLQVLHAAEPGGDDFLLIHERGRVERVPLAEVLCLKAEQKYLTVRTRERSFIIEGSLSELEHRHAAHFLRIHRNALVARRAVRALERQFDPQEGAEGWAVRLTGLDEALPVSRRQLAAVRAALGENAV